MIAFFLDKHKFMVFLSFLEEASVIVVDSVIKLPFKLSISKYANGRDLSSKSKLVQSVGKLIKVAQMVNGDFATKAIKSTEGFVRDYQPLY